MQGYRSDDNNGKKLRFLLCLIQHYKYSALWRASVVFLGPRANAELVPKFHVALHASHAALPMVALEISLCANMTLKYEDLVLQVEGVSDETVK
jgi:hypothetical protein